MKAMSQGKMRCHKGRETVVMYRFTDDAAPAALTYGTIIGNLADVHPEVFARKVTLVCEDATEVSIIISEHGARFANFITSGA